MSHNFSDFYDYDPSHGIIKTRNLGTRVFLNSSEAWIQMKEKMFEAFTSGAASILFGIGVFYGSKITLFMEGRGAHPIEILNSAREFGLRSGWGKITPRMSPEGLIVTVEDCCYCHGMKAKQEVCYELAGIISGALETITNEKIHVKETKCNAKGDRFCEIVAEIPKNLRSKLINE